MTEPLRWGIISTGGIARTFVRDLSFIDSGVGGRRRFAVDGVGKRLWRRVRHRVVDTARTKSSSTTPRSKRSTWRRRIRMHFDNAMLALDAGKPVLVEKAFTVTAREAARTRRGRARQEASS